MLKELIIPSANLEVVKQFSGGKDRLGYQLKQASWDENNLPDMFIVGVPEARTSFCRDFAEGPDRIRQQLFTLSGFPENFRIVDLGNIKTGKDATNTFAAVKMVSEELSVFGIPILIIGGSQDITVPLISGFEKEELHLAVIDDRIDNYGESGNSNDEIFINNLPFRTIVNLIAVQSFFINQLNKEEVTEAFTGNVISLGELRSDIRNTEPLLRETDLVSFDYGSIKISEAPGQYRNSPNGLTGEEACQLAWYSGIATSPVWFGFFGYAPKLDPSSNGAMMAAQICWYFLNGVSKRIDKAPADEAVDFIHFQVPIDGLDEPVTFLKHPVSKRWWMEVPSLDCETFPLRVPCSKKDYKKACKNEIPEKWWSYFNQQY
jgi:formiminoglutamase